MMLEDSLATGEIYQPQILHSTEMPLKKGGKIKPFSDKQKLEKNPSSVTCSEETFKEVLQAEGQY